MLTNKEEMLAFIWNKIPVIILEGADNLQPLLDQLKEQYGI